MNMIDIKEAYYFCTDFHEESDHFHKRILRFPIRTEKQYLTLFQRAAQQKIIGDATPDYLYSRVAAKNIAEFNKDAKILISIRNPIDFLYSLHARLLADGSEDISDFKEHVAYSRFWEGPEI